MKIQCQNCKESVTIRYHKNRWAESFVGNCDTCGWRFLLKDTEFDIIQPSSPFFEIIYKFHPEKEKVMRIKKREWEKEKEKEKLEDRYRRMKREGKLKPWEIPSIKKITLEEKDY